MRAGVPVTVSMILMVAVGLTATPGGAQELPFVCDADLDGTVSAEELQGCAEQCSDRARSGAHGLALEPFAAALPDAGGLQQQFAQADQDGDGRISRDEWIEWSGPACHRLAGIVSLMDLSGRD